MHHKTRARPYVILFSLLFLLSCASAPRKGQTPSEQQIREIESTRKVNALNEKILMSALTARRSLNRDYKIGPQDLLEITVFDVEKLNKTVRVSGQGNINLPLLGVLKVKGLTVEELEREIRSLLAEKYIKDPQVNVLIKEYRNQQITVMGAVKNPGVYDVTGSKMILDMLAVAGGLREDAGQLLFLLRPPRPEEGLSKGPKAGSDQKPETFVIDLEESLAKGDLALTFPLLHGDVINVPVAGKVFVGGEVKAPGGFAKGRKMTLSQAIVLAGGLKPEAAGSETKIFRNSGRGTGKEIITVNAYTILKGKEEDVYLKENDIIIVPSSGVKSFLIGVKDTISASFGLGKVSLGL
jgi:polysaccharide export outer membrane protein